MHVTANDVTYRSEHFIKTDKEPPNHWSWSWSPYCGRQTDDQFVWVSGLPLGPSTRFYLVLLFSADNYLIILSTASSIRVILALYTQIVG
jgi:hypothetical protein